MHLAVLSGFMAALAAPWLHRLARGLSGWLMALLPLGLFLYFAGFLGPLAGGETFRANISWAPSLGVELAFHLDGLAVLFALLITGIGALVMIYAGSYLEGHPLIGRFYAYLAMFMASMLGLVLAGNLLLLFVFWELTSLSSYLLIGFEHRREEARDAALQALLVTGGGGLALMAGLVLLGQVGGAWDFSSLNEAGDLVRESRLYLPILLLVALGALTKSAQFPFHFWLPGAMEAPAPVSAYLHSATMVNAGIYLLARLSQTLGGTPAWTALIAGAGLLTTLAGAYLALTHTHLKRLLAYLTVSALGTMVMLVGLGGEEGVQAALVTLLAHALYKGALFMSAGALDHETGASEVTEMGGYWRKMPVLAVATWLAALSLSALGPVLSFIGKEMLLASGLDRAPIYGAAAVIAGAASVAGALVVGLKPFLGEPGAGAERVHEPPAGLWLGPAVLGVLGLVLGLFPGLVSSTLIAPAASAVLGEPQEVELALWHGLGLPLALSGLSLLLGLLAYRYWPAWLRTSGRLAAALPWGPQAGYRASLDGLTWFAGRFTALVQTGHLNHYLGAVVAAAILLVAGTLLTREEKYTPQFLTGITVYEVVVALLIVLATLAAVRSRSRLAAVTALGVVGFGIALIFVLYGAPDLAMTQILVESITVILLVLILYHLPGFARLSGRVDRVRDAAIATGAGVLMTTLVLIAYSTEHLPPVSAYYLANSVELAHGRNIVNVILVDFRGLDTLGEITVLTLAATGVLALLKLKPFRKEKKE